MASIILLFLDTLEAPYTVLRERTVHRSGVTSLGPATDVMDSIPLTVTDTWGTTTVVHGDNTTIISTDISEAHPTVLTGNTAAPVSVVLEAYHTVHTVSMTEI
jgi:hypothetical protein